MSSLLPSTHNTRLTAYVNEHPEIDINIIIPNEENIKKVLESL